MRNFGIKALLAGSLLGISLISYARITGVQPGGTNADEWCVGGRARANVPLSATETCVDVNGNFTATSTGSVTQLLGTAATPWNGVYVNSIDTAGVQGTTVPFGMNGVTNVVGSTMAANGTAGSYFMVSGLFGWPTSPVGVSASSANGVHISTQIPVNSSAEVLISSGNMVTLTSTPNIATTTVLGGTLGIPDGTFLLLSATSPVSGVQFQSTGTLTGSGLRLGAPLRSVFLGKTLLLRFNAVLSLWEELFYGNN